jgi:hypothetical protein
VRARTHCSARDSGAGSGPNLRPLLFPPAAAHTHGRGRYNDSAHERARVCAEWYGDRGGEVNGKLIPVPYGTYHLRLRPQRQPPSPRLVSRSRAGCLGGPRSSSAATPRPLFASPSQLVAHTHGHTGHASAPCQPSRKKTPAAHTEAEGDQQERERENEHAPRPVQQRRWRGTRAA